ncbi:MAG TPA: SprB repeat-containing protein, partial [Saprospiraceae bacterium]|nr:SprB repeat-containing protein [Saprospiraceae bacterium]
TGCIGDGYSVVVNGNTYNEGNPSGNETLTNSNGCDSVVTISLTFNDVFTGIETYTGCIGDGYSVVVNGTTYNENNPTGEETLDGTNGCDSIVTISLVFNLAPDVAITQAGPFCLEAGVQTLSAIPTDGVWSGAVSSNQFNPLVLGVGQHQVIYTASSGICSDADTIIVIIHPEVIVACASVQDDSGANDGIGTVTVSAGTPAFTITWSGPVSGSTVLNTTGTHTITDLPAGTYQILVTDANGCTDQCTFTIEFVGCTIAIDAIDIIPVSCAGNADGAIQILASGGTVPYSYSIDGINFQNANFFTGLAAGMYTVIVQDAGNCVEIASIEIPVNPGPELELSGVTAASCGQANGSLEVMPNGGTSPYIFTLGGDEQPIGIFTNLAAGTHEVILEDANGCTDTLTVIVPDDGAPQIDSTIVNDATCGMPNGTILVLASGGAPPLMYSIGGPPQLFNVFADLSAGTYTVTVTDQNDCVVTQVVQIVNIGGPMINNVSTTAALCGTGSGSITVFASGGTGTLQYSIDGGPFSVNPTFNNLPSGPHTMTVIDANGCTATQIVNVPNLDGPQIISTPVVHTTCGSGSGQITVNASGGTGELLYSLNNGPFQNNNFFDDLDPGN